MAQVYAVAAVCGTLRGGDPGVMHLQGRDMEVEDRRHQVVGGERREVAAPPPEPGRLEVLGQRYLANPLLRPLYGRYVDQMGLRGDECVLDYGSGSGAAARHLAKRLEAGGGRLTCMDVSTRWQVAIRKDLRTFATVDYRCGDVRSMGLSEGSFDVVLVHWMLHDVPPWDRPSILAELARLLRPGGRLFTREPTSAKHGMPAAEVRRLLTAAGLIESQDAEGRMRLVGAYYRGVWTRPA